jgi:hypothetical protein
MKKVIKSIFIVLFIVPFLGFTIKFEPIDCKKLHKGIFMYGDNNTEIKVVIKGKSHIEYHQEGKYIIQSEIKWVNNCEYNMTMIKVTIPDFPYGKGDVMNVKINEVKGNEIFYTSTVKGISWQGKLIKIK